MDKIFISKLSVPVLIGVLPEERRAPQTILFDLELESDIRQASASDELQHTIDYAAIRRSIIHYVKETEFELVETLADNLAHHLQKAFDISRLRLVLTKKPFDIPDAEGVGVIIERC